MRVIQKVFIQARLEFCKKSATSTKSINSIIYKKRKVYLAASVGVAHSCENQIVNAVSLTALSKR